MRVVIAEDGVLIREGIAGLLRRLAAGRPVAVVVDDDAQVCDAYEAAGYRVLRARWMTASPVLERAQEDEGRT